MGRLLAQTAGPLCVQHANMSRTAPLALHPPDLGCLSSHCLEQCRHADGGPAEEYCVQLLGGSSNVPCACCRQAAGCLNCPLRCLWL